MALAVGNISFYLLQPGDEVICGPLGRPLRIGKSNQVGQGMVAEKEMQFIASGLEQVGLIQPFPAFTQCSDAAGQSGRRSARQRFHAR